MEINGGRERKKMKKGELPVSQKTVFSDICKKRAQIKKVTYDSHGRTQSLGLKS